MMEQFYLFPVGILVSTCIHFSLKYRKVEATLYLIVILTTKPTQVIRLNDKHKKP